MCKICMAGRDHLKKVKSLIIFHSRIFYISETLQKLAQLLSLTTRQRSARSTGFFSSLNYDERFEEWDDLEGNWAENQPDNQGGDQFCVYLDADGKYDDFWCGTKELVYFCQKRPAKFSHIYHQEFPDAFKVGVLNQYCTKESCKFFSKGNDTSQSRSGALSDAQSWLNFDPLFAIESRPYYFKLNWGSGAFITWSQLQNPLEIEDDAEITPSDLTFYPADGIKEFGNGFRTCDGLFFSGLRRSSNEHVFLDGSRGGESFYQVGIAPEAFSFGFGFKHVLSFPMHEPRYIINPEVDNWYEECWDRSKIRDNLRQNTRDLMIDSFRKTRTNAAPRQGYRSDSNPVKTVDLFVSDQPFPNHGSLECNSQFTMKEHSVAVEGGYQCLKRELNNIILILYVLESSERVHDSCFHGNATRSNDRAPRRCCRRRCFEKGIDSLCWRRNSRSSCGNTWLAILAKALGSSKEEIKRSQRLDKGSSNNYLKIF